MRVIEALTGLQDSIQRMEDEFRSRRDLVVAGMNEIPGITCRHLSGVFYVFPNVGKPGMSSEHLADYLLNKAGVAILAGTSFGRFGEGYLRLSCATSKENINAALERINKAAVDISA